MAVHSYIKGLITKLFVHSRFQSLFTCIPTCTYKTPADRQKYKTVFLLLFCFYFQGGGVQIDYSFVFVCFLISYRYHVLFNLHFFNLKRLCRHLFYILIKHNIWTQLRIHVPFSKRKHFFFQLHCRVQKIAIKYYSKFIGLLNKNR